jgi:transposase
MSFVFYPNHQYACPHISHCPHLGGAALGTLVDAAEEHEEFHRMLFGQLDAARKSVERLLEENQRLQKELEQVRLELKVERQNKFRPSTLSEDLQESDHASEPPVAESAAGESAAEPKQSKKRGAPLGHPGWFRPTPKSFDVLVEVSAPRTCAHCGGQVKLLERDPPFDHLQQDLVGDVCQVVCYRHQPAECPACRRVARQAGEGELLGSHLGPMLRAKALFLRHEIGISYRHVPAVLEELLGVTFTPAALLAFEKLLAQRAEPIAEDIRKKVASSDGAVHADETFWRVEQRQAYFWLHATEEYLYFQFDTSRSGQVSRDILGPHFCGTLVTDCYAGYDASVAQNKQKCLAHLARAARDWQKLTSKDSLSFTFFEDVKAWVRRGCEFARKRKAGLLSAEELQSESAWLRAELSRLMSCELDHAKAKTLQERLKRYADQWLVFLDHPEVSPTNNLAERALRPLVIFRKISFGNRTGAGARRLGVLMTVKETAKRQGRRPSEFFYYLLTHPPDAALRHLYRGKAA